MNELKTRLLQQIAVATFMLTSFATNCFANENERIIRLEKEIQEIKQRLSNIESPQSTSQSNPKPLASGDGWKSLANWRRLNTGMNPAEVRAILGEPHRIIGGDLATWRYTNRGSVEFFLEKLHRWNEP
jgi:hypothetical protein